MKRLLFFILSFTFLLTSCEEYTEIPSLEYTKYEGTISVTNLTSNLTSTAKYDIIIEFFGNNKDNNVKYIIYKVGGQSKTRNCRYNQNVNYVVFDKFDYEEDVFAYGSYWFTDYYGDKMELTCHRSNTTVQLHLKKISL